MKTSKILPIVEQFEKGKMSRRDLTKRFAALGASAGVASLAVATGSATLGANLAAAQEASARGYLTANNEQQATYIRNFNPLGPAGGSVRWHAQFSMYEPLYMWNYLKGEAQPWLATDWGFNEDASVLTVNLREGVQWADGEDFNADDVVFTWQLFQSNDSLGGNGARTALNFIDEIEKVDDYTVLFKFGEINTTAIHEVGGQVIVPEHIWADIEDPVTYPNEEPVGTGSFVLERFEEQIYEIAANPNYWQEGRPAIPGLRMPAFPSNDSLHLALLNGELDWTANFVPDIDTLYVAEDPENHGYFFPPLGAAVALYMNNEVAPFDDVTVRKAINMAIDREQICNIAMYDYTHPSDPTGLSDAFDFIKDEEAVNAGWTTLNVEEANSLLDEAGYEYDGDIRVDLDGNPMSYEINVVSGWSDWVQSVELIAGHLREIGIEAVVNPYDYTPWLERLNEGNFGLSIGWGFQGPTPVNHFRATMSDQSYYPIGDNRAGENWGRINDQEISDLIRQAVAEPDPDAQAELYKAMQRRFAEYVPFAPLFPGPMWGQYNRTRYDGFPDEDNPYAVLSTWEPVSIILMNSLFPTGEEPEGWSIADPEGDGNITIDAPAYERSGDEASPEATPAG